MTLFFRRWGGHLLLIPLVLMCLLTIWLISRVFAETGPGDSSLFFILSVFSALGVLAIAGWTAYVWATPRQRHLIRNEEVPVRRQTYVGGSGAHSASPNTDRP